jgi:hypothetical protein
MTYQMDNAPSVNGFAAGVSWTNTTIYVGRAHLNGQFMPGRVQTEAPTGVYVNYGAEYIRDTDLEYLVMASGCVCTWMSTALAMLSTGIVHMPDLSYHFAVGRVTFASGHVAISKTALPSFTQWYVSDTGSGMSDIATEVLVCESNDPSAKPVVNYATAACGGF